MSVIAKRKEKQITLPFVLSALCRLATAGTAVSTRFARVGWRRRAARTKINECHCKKKKKTNHLTVCFVGAVPTGNSRHGCEHAIRARRMASTRCTDKNK